MDIGNLPEFRFSYWTTRYAETISFYKEVLELREFRSWDRGECEKGTMFFSPNGTGLIEIEEGKETSIIKGAELYVQVEDVDTWYKKAVEKNVEIIYPIKDTSYGHRVFKFVDPNGLVFGLFKYLK
jgi:predicted enzyme related to lactoylglutathione lyase